MFDHIQSIDRSVFFLINGWHDPFVDELMYFVSLRIVWLPLYLFIAFLLVKKYKKNSLYIIFVAILVIVITDKLTVILFKNTVLRLRPCHEPSLQAMVHLVKGYCGGKYGFISSHAANSFALIMFLKKYIKSSSYLYPLLMIWALIICYSRIYIGVHYPCDVLVGIIFGSFLGWLVSYLFYRFYAKSFVVRV